MKRSASGGGKPPARNASCHWASLKRWRRPQIQRTSAGVMSSSSLSWRPRQSNVTRPQGIGIANTRARLQALYGDRQTMELRQGEGLVVSLRIPVSA